MKYFLDTEFIEGTQKDYKIIKFMKRISILILIYVLADFLSFDFNAKSLVARLIFIAMSSVTVFFSIQTYLRSKNLTTPPTIDLISIGIVSEDGRELYEISKDFNLKDAWNRYDLKERWINGVCTKHKEYWIRENVLYPIFRGLLVKEGIELDFVGYSTKDMCNRYSFKDFKNLVNKYGKTNKEIAEQIKLFTKQENTLHKLVSKEGEDLGSVLFYHKRDNDIRDWENKHPNCTKTTYNAKIDFYAYYADYDWVVFCWLFGKMIDLPNGFPMYCRDLQQMLDEKQQYLLEQHGDVFRVPIKNYFDSYPTQDPNKQHNAIEDARWNQQLFNFLKSI